MARRATSLAHRPGCWSEPGHGDCAVEHAKTLTRALRELVRAKDNEQRAEADAFRGIVSDDPVAADDAFAVRREAAKRLEGAWTTVRALIA